VALPFALLLLDYWPLQRFAPQPRTRGFGIPRRLILEKIPLLALSVVAGVVTCFAEGEAVMSVAHIPIAARIGNVVISYVVYLRQMVWPSGLAVFYPYPQRGYPLWETALVVLLLAWGSGGALALWRKRPWFFVGWFWYLGMLAPVIGIVAVNASAHGDRHTYLPEIGLALAWTWAVADWGAGWKHRRVIFGGLMTAVIAALMVCAHFQTSYWRDSESLWSHTVARTSDNSLAQNNLGVALFQKGKVDEAIDHGQKALQIKPNDAEAQDNLGCYLLQKSRVEEAMAHLQTALQIEPNNVKAHINLGLALLQQGNVDEAIAHFQEAAQIQPGFADAYNNLGIALVQKGRVDEALPEYQKSLQLQPNHAETYCNLGNALLKKGDVEEAIRQLQKAVQIKPDFAAAHFNFGNAFLQKGNVDDAISQYQTALQITPDYADARHNLGTAFLRKGDLGEAIVCYQQALKINPRSADDYGNLGVAFFRKGEIQQAMDSWQKGLEIKPDQLDVLNHLAWLLATTPDASLRNGAKAVALATQAKQLSGNGNPMTLHTLAAAYAETGNYALAAVTARRGLELAVAQKNDALAATLREEIQLYEAGKPARDGTTEGSAPMGRLVPP
jgi:tetratricopeptide (TPR) repeat protein